MRLWSIRHMTEIQKCIEMIQLYIFFKWAEQKHQSKGIYKYFVKYEINVLHFQFFAMICPFYHICIKVELKACTVHVSLIHWQFLPLTQESSIAQKWNRISPSTCIMLLCQTLNIICILSSLHLMLFTRGTYF